MKKGHRSNRSVSVHLKSLPHDAGKSLQSFNYVFAGCCCLLSIKRQYFAYSKNETSSNSKSMSPSVNDFECAVS